MGIVHGITRFLGFKKDEEDPLHDPCLLHQKQNHNPCDGHSSTDKKILKFPRLIILKAIIKGLLQKVLFVSHIRKPGRKADPILPVQNPAPSTSHDEYDPSLLQPLTISDSSSDSTSTEISPVADIENNVAVVSCEISNSTANREQGNCVITSMPDLTGSLACTSVSQEILDSAVITEESMGMEMNSSEEKVIIKSKVVVVEEKREEDIAGIRWIKHYSNHHRILLVGEGDFSFSACLALAFGWASNIIATSLDSKEFLKENYKNATPNIKALRKRGSKVMHGIDATKLAEHLQLGYLEFDRIVFNFPFAGFFKDLSRKNQLRRHRRLVSLFLKNAKEMMSENGEIHITHKSNDFHNEWNLESIASSHGLRLIEAVNFNRDEYPGYNTKYGFGGDNNFNCHPAKTYKFRLKRLPY